MRCLPPIHADYKMWLVLRSRSCSQPLSWILKPTFHHLACALSFPRLSVKAVKRIPRASRDRSPGKLAYILDQVTSGGSEAALNRLFCFARAVFECQTGGGGHRRSPASRINLLIGVESDPTPDQLQPVPERRNNRPDRDPL